MSDDKSAGLTFEELWKNVVEQNAALRAEVERLRNLYGAPLELAAQRDALLKAVEGAPHHYNCELMECRRNHGHRTKPPCPCDCWKRAALEGK